MEKTGQAVDASYMSTTRLVCAFHLFSHLTLFYLPLPPKLQELEQNFSEPLHEYTQFASIIKKLLAYRHQKHVQYEMTQDALENKRDMLEEYEKSEREAKRLEEALSRGRVNGPTKPPSEGQSSENPDDSASVYIPPHPGPSPYKRRAPGMGLLNALSYTLHGMMDVDPETARRNGIGKTRETISQVSFMVGRWCHSDAALLWLEARGRASFDGAGLEVFKFDNSSRSRSLPTPEGRRPQRDDNQYGQKSQRLV